MNHDIFTFNHEYLPEADYRKRLNMDKKTIVIGIGGIGCRLGSEFAVKAARHRRVLCVAVDTDPDDLQQYDGREGHIVMPLYDPATLGKIAERLGPDTIDSWFPPVLLNAAGPSLAASDMSAGTGAYRAKALLLFEDFLSKDDVRDSVLSAVRTFLTDTPDASEREENPHASENDPETPPVDSPDAELEVYVTASLGGGTGSGLFTAVTAYLKKTIFDRFCRKVHTAAYLISPEDLEGVQTLKGCANAAAALDELDALMSGRPLMNGSSFRIGQENDPRMGVLADSAQNGMTIFDTVTLLHAQPRVHTVDACLQQWSDIMLLRALGAVECPPPVTAQRSFSTASIRSAGYSPDAVIGDFSERVCIRYIREDWLPMAKEERMAWNAFRLIHTDYEVDQYLPTVSDILTRWRYPIHSSAQLLQECIDRTVAGVVDTTAFDLMLPDTAQNGTGTDSSDVKKPSVWKRRASVRERRKTDTSAARMLAREGGAMLSSYAASCRERLAAVYDDEAIRGILFDGLRQADGLYPHPFIAMSDLCTVAASLSVSLGEEKDRISDEESMLSDTLLNENDYLADRRCCSDGELRHADLMWPKRLWIDPKPKTASVSNGESTGSAENERPEEAPSPAKTEKDKKPACSPIDDKVFTYKDLDTLRTALAKLRDRIKRHVTGVLYQQMFRVLMREIARFRSLFEKLPYALDMACGNTTAPFADSRQIGLSGMRQARLYAVCEKDLLTDEHNRSMLDDAAFRMMFVQDCPTSRTALRRGLTEWMKCVEPVCDRSDWMDRERSKDIISVMCETPGEIQSQLSSLPPVPPQSFRMKNDQAGVRKRSATVLCLSPACAAQLLDAADQNLPGYLRKLDVEELQPVVCKQLPDNVLYMVSTISDLSLADLPGMNENGLLTDSLRTACARADIYETRMWNPYLAYSEKEEEDV